MGIKSSNKKGDDFENEIRHLLIVGGYKPIKNAMIDGQQVDLLFERPLKFQRTETILIECKFLSTKSVSNQDVYDFIAMLTSLKRSRSVDVGIIVTNRGFSKTARQASEKHDDILLFEKIELERELISIDAAYQTKIRNYEQSPIFEKYINLPIYDLVNSETKSAEFDPVESLYESIAEIDRGLSFFIGDFGSGKTTLMHRLSWRIMCGAEDSKVPLILVFATLKDYLNYNDPKTFFFSAASEFINKNLDERLLNELKSSHKVVAIFDGFDEIKTHSESEERKEFLFGLFRLSEFADHIVITSRPSHFTSLEEISDFLTSAVEGWKSESIQHYRLPNHKKNRHLKKIAQQDEKVFGEVSPFSRQLRKFKIASCYRLSPLSKEHITAFLESNTTIVELYGIPASQIVDKLFEIYDLEDILSRPFLLDLLVGLLEEGDINLKDPNLEIGPAALYTRYINMTETRDWSKGSRRRFFSMDERIKFAISAAYLIYYNGEGLELDSDELPDIFDMSIELFGEEFCGEKLRGYSPDAVLTDIRTCSFLTISSNGKITFVHKSFLEYFIALQIRDSLDKDVFLKILEENLADEILYFLGSFTLIDKHFEFKITEYLRHTKFGMTEITSKNLKKAMILGRHTTSGQDLDQLSFEGVGFKNKLFQSCKFTSVDFEGCSVSKMQFQNSVFSDTTFEKNVGEKTSFTNCTGDMSFSQNHCEIEVINHRNGEMSFVGSNVKAQITNAQQSAFIAKNYSFQEKTFQNCENISVEFEAFSGTLKFAGCRGSEVTLLTEASKRQFYVEFSNCDFSYIVVNSHVLTQFLDNSASLDGSRMCIVVRGHVPKNNIMQGVITRRFKRNGKNETRNESYPRPWGWREKTLFVTEKFLLESGIDEKSVNNLPSEEIDTLFEKLFEKPIS